MFKNYLWTFFTIIVASCANEDISAPMEKQCQHDANIESDLSNALNKAAKLKEIIYGDSMPVKHELSKLNIEPVMCTATRSEDTPSYYIVNYGNDEGYAVITTIPGMDQVQAISDKGSLHISDTISNKGLAAFFSNLDANISQLYASNAVNPIDMTTHDFQPLIRNERTEKLKPLLNVNVRNWHQDEPYNQMCPDYLTHPKKVGCLAVSATQIMSYYEWPTKLDNYDVDWNKVKMKNSLIAYQVLATVGSSKYLDLNYQYIINNDGTVTSETFGYELKAVKDFEKLQYAPLATATIFSDLKAAQDLKSGPLWVHTSNKPIWDSPKHAWVIDGYINQYREVWTSLNSGGDDYYWQPVNSYLFHCVWGEKDLSNGYFRWNNNNNSIGGDKPISYEIGENRGDSVYTGYSVHYYTGFTKVK